MILDVDKNTKTEHYDNALFFKKE